MTKPASECIDLQGKFQQQVRQAFAEARVAGIKQPLLCGAIPFDTQQPSALFIPYESRCFDRATLVVLSRLLEIETCQPVDCHALMACVIVRNPHGFHFHVPLERRALLGASPELLPRQSNGRFYSNPLAGSARRVADAECDLVVGQQLMASEKDRHEHRIVTEGIRQVLASRSHYPLILHNSVPVRGKYRL